ncbi:hypothetical protein NIIDMKKI_22240 [Mycobacterium kansasii]|uniref:Carrier domain-containing protein n=1 Tax=Mycobacterium kansasii TaxID=1768 RepID=A0A7G1IET1_MYCKA|nr:hypothetical protein NIIDMKKI_22240 [Mycobacterium kansasii]
MKPLGDNWISKDEIRAAIAAELGCPADELGDHDDLIQLGLNSIRMMGLAGGWRKRGADITFAQLAAAPTVASWYALLSGDTASSAAAPAAVAPDEPEAHDAPFPLAGMQLAYWIGRSDEQELGGVAAHLYAEFDGPAIDPDRLQRAVRDLVATHPMLRTRFLPTGLSKRCPSRGGRFLPRSTFADAVRRRCSRHSRNCARPRHTNGCTSKTVRSSTSR